ncbi:unnamed protein product [Blepharisma stoltei]|uniref:t-SNARE coiled-coil homology domain-containing protein n=1 Tax=Blepharisma stoltei TaxID=1481888 RepID=A0AAU9ITT9_9CILI|nr:unnamed protein product [Blepharisma stoltei]
MGKRQASLLGDVKFLRLKMRWGRKIIRDHKSFIKMNNIFQSNGILGLYSKELSDVKELPIGNSQDINEKHKIFKEKVESFYKTRKENEDESISIQLETNYDEEHKKLLESSEKLKNFCEEIESELNTNKELISDLEETSESNNYLAQKLRQKAKELINKATYPCLTAIIVILLIMILIELCY